MVGVVGGKCEMGWSESPCSVVGDVRSLALCC